MRPISLLALAAWLCVAGVVHADDATPVPSGPDAADTQPVDAPTADAAAPAGPTLQPSDYAPVICDPSAAGFRFLEVRGTGFDAWARQRLVGSLVDARGVAQMQWGSVWVSPQGGLTLEVNLCSDPFRNRSALPAGGYTLSVGGGSGRTIAATSIALSPPPDAPVISDDTAPETVPLPTPAATNSAVAPTTPPLVMPNADSPATPTPLPLPTLSPLAGPTATPGPRTGLGSKTQPFPLGAPGMLADGWQLVVTGVTADAWAGIKAAVPSTQAPAPDQHDYLLRIQATYLGQSTGVFSATRLALVGSSQIVYDQIHNGCGIIPDMVPPNLVTSGGVTRGNVCFAVRTAEQSSLVLFDNDTIQGDQVYFSLS